MFEIVEKTPALCVICGLTMPADRKENNFSTCSDACADRWLDEDIEKKFEAYNGKGSGDE